MGLIGIRLYTIALYTLYVLKPLVGIRANHIIGLVSIRPYAITLYTLYILRPLVGIKANYIVGLVGIKPCANSAICFIYAKTSNKYKC